jgi:hypothetical protein
MDDSNIVEIDQPCLIRRGPLAGLTGVVTGCEGQRVLLRLDSLAGVRLALPSEAIEVQTVA